MSYYWFNRQEILQNTKERYSKEKAADYYLKNKGAIKNKNSKSKEYQRKEKRINSWFSIKKKR